MILQGTVSEGVGASRGGIKGGGFMRSKTPYAPQGGAADLMRCARTATVLRMMYADGRR